MFAVTGGFTPLWLGPVGLGLSGELGWKTDDISASNGKITIDRFPALATAHMLAHVDKNSYFVLLAGAQVDLGIMLGTKGVQPFDFGLETGVGLVAGGGYCHSFGSNFTMDGSVRVVKMDYHAHTNTGATGTLGANHIAFLLGGHYQFD